MNFCDAIHGILICGGYGFMASGDWPHMLSVFVALPAALLALGFVIGLAVHR